MTQARQLGENFIAFNAWTPRTAVPGIRSVKCGIGERDGLGERGGASRRDHRLCQRRQAHPVDDDVFIRPPDVGAPECRVGTTTSGRFDQHFDRRWPVGQHGEAPDRGRRLTGEYRRLGREQLRGAQSGQKGVVPRVGCHKRPLDVFGSPIGAADDGEEQTGSHGRHQFGLSAARTNVTRKHEFVAPCGSRVSCHPPSVPTCTAPTGDNSPSVNGDSHPPPCGRQVPRERSRAHGSRRVALRFIATADVRTTALATNLSAGRRCGCGGSGYGATAPIATARLAVPVKPMATASAGLVLGALPSPV